MYILEVAVLEEIVDKDIVEEETRSPVRSDVFDNDSNKKDYINMDHSIDIEQSDNYLSKC